MLLCILHTQQQKTKKMACVHCHSALLRLTQNWNRLNVKSMTFSFTGYARAIIIIYSIHTHTQKRGYDIRTYTRPSARTQPHSIDAIEAFSAVARMKRTLYLSMPRVQRVAVAVGMWECLCWARERARAPVCVLVCTLLSSRVCACARRVCVHVSMCINTMFNGFRWFVSIQWNFSHNSIALFNAYRTNPDNDHSTHAGHKMKQQNRRFAPIRMPFEPISSRE